MPVMVHENNTVLVSFLPSDDPEESGKKVQTYKIHYTKGEPGLADVEWNEVGKREEGEREEGKKDKGRRTNWNGR